jgi:hypothetical protein
MSQKICFICKTEISNNIKSATCNNLKCQQEYSIQHNTWKQIEMDYLYGIKYDPTGDEE